MRALFLIFIAAACVQSPVADAGKGDDGGAVTAGDAGERDAGERDAGQHDAGAPDAGFSCPQVNSCYTQLHGAPGVGRCRSGLQCAMQPDAGCVGELGPTAEACNGIDDDCNGIVDDACGCAYVAPSGDDSQPGTAALPVRRITAGITIAADAGVDRVCVAAGPTCPADFPYGALQEALVMRNGVSVYGQYESSTWTRSTACRTTFVAFPDAGVLFGSNVVAPTVLDGFGIIGYVFDDRPSPVAISGSKGAVLSNNFITASWAPDASVALDIFGGATPVIRNCHIRSGTGFASSIAIRSRDSSPLIVENCGAFDDAGRCSDNGGGAGIWAVANTSPTREAIAVLLENSPGTVIDSTNIRGGSAAPGALNAGVVITGNAAGTIIRGSLINGGSFSSATSVGIDLRDCGDTSPVIEDNVEVRGSSDPFATGFAVRSGVGCNPRIRRNARVVACGVVTGTSGCVAIECAEGQCDIVENGSISGGLRGVGIRARHATALISRNRIVDACLQTRIGIESIESNARIENNIIRVCNENAAGLRIVNGPSRAEADVHSNTIVTVGFEAELCASAAVVFDASDGGHDGGPAGLLRNNVLAASKPCVVHEAHPAADPRIFEYNLLQSPDPLYRDEASVDLVDGGWPGSANVSGDAGLVGDFRITATSMCRNAGTDAGAPPIDIDGDVRPSGGGFEIGADEL